MAELLLAHVNKNLVRVGKLVSGIGSYQKSYDLVKAIRIRWMSTPSVQESSEQGFVSRQAREEACMWQALVRYSLGTVDDGEGRNVLEVSEKKTITPVECIELQLSCNKTLIPTVRSAYMMLSAVVWCSDGRAEVKEL
ncbi:hypothetical protein NC652_020622 [Populus alba x Populus x berolinensis]|nr:hypothetical protein NC652_020622 [Populus alba x Populus x berolinensis]